MDLLSYDSSSGGETAATSSTNAKRKSLTAAKDAPPKRRKQLPKLPTTFTTAPVDDPSAHQGRSRSRRWIEGDWNAHVFLKLKIPAALRAVLNDIIQQAQNELSNYGSPCTVHPLYETSGKESRSTLPSTLIDNTGPAQSTQKELHISLTHPLPLRAHQIPLLLDHIKAMLTTSGKRRIKPFHLGLDCRVVKYRNGILRGTSHRQPGGGDHSPTEHADPLESCEEDLLADSIGNEHVTQGRDALKGLGQTGVGKGGRAFLALRVRAGHDELEYVQSQIIDPFLRVHHLPTYHSQPEFHTSFAWVLVPVPGQSFQDGEQNSTDDTPYKGDPFTDQLLQRLEERFGQALLDAQPRGGWTVEAISTKIGKTIRDFPFVMP